MYMTEDVVERFDPLLYSTEQLHTASPHTIKARISVTLKRKKELVFNTQSTMVVTSGQTLKMKSAKSNMNHAWNAMMHSYTAVCTHFRL